MLGYESADGLARCDGAWRRADGSLVRLRENVREVRGAGGRVEFYEGVVEAAEAAADGVLTTDESGRVLAVNSRLVSLFGIERIDDAFATIAATLTVRSARLLDALRRGPDRSTPLRLFDTAGRTFSLISWRQAPGRAFSFRALDEGDRHHAVRPMVALLARAARTMFSAEEASRFLFRVLAAATRATGAPYGFALIATDDPRTFRVGCEVHAEACGIREDSRIEVAPEIVDIFLSGTAAVVDAGLISECAARLAGRICVAPLIVDSRPLGLLCVGVSDPRALRDSDFGTLAAFATIAALSIDRWSRFDRLAASESRYRALVENVNEGIAWAAADDTLFFVNQRLSEILGWPREELIGRRFEALTRGGEVRLRRKDGVEITVDVAVSIVDDSCICVVRDVSELKAAEENLRLVVESADDPILMTDGNDAIVFANHAAQRVFGYRGPELLQLPLRSLLPAAHVETRETMGVTSVGNSIPFEVSAGRVATSHGTRTTWILRDASARKREAEQQDTLRRVLQAVAREWTATFDAVDSPMLVLDADLTIRRLNRAARDLFGAGYGELVGRRADAVGTVEPWITGVELCRRVAASRNPETTQLREEQLKRTWDISAQLGATQMFPREEPFVILTLRDVSHFVELQETIRRSEVLAVLGAIVGGVAHEVRNPLFAISVAVDAFEKEIDGGSDIADYVRIFRGEIDRLSTLMQDLLAFGKPPGREHRCESLTEVLYAARQQCMREMQSRNVRVEVSAQGELRMNMDEQRMTQLFQNLIENAVQHSPAESAVEVRAYADPGSPMIHCQVVDRGAGFAPEDLQHAFEPFFSRRNGGTGLGLALVQRIAEEHRGSLVLSNGAGGGAIADIVFHSGAE